MEILLRILAGSKRQFLSKENRPTIIKECFRVLGAIFSIRSSPIEGVEISLFLPYPVNLILRPGLKVNLIKPKVD